MTLLQLKLSLEYNGTGVKTYYIRSLLLSNFNVMGSTSQRKLCSVLTKNYDNVNNTFLSSLK